MQQRARDIAFVSSHRTDLVWLDRLEVHLKPLLRRLGLTYFCDTKLHAGDVVRERIDSALSRACILVLLVSGDYLASTEFEDMLCAVQAHHVKLLWLPVNSSGYADTRLVDIASLWDPELPLALLKNSEAEAALVVVCQRIADACISKCLGVDQSALVQTSSSLGTANSSSSEDRKILSKFLARPLLRQPAAWFGYSIVVVGLTMVSRENSMSQPPTSIISKPASALPQVPMLTSAPSGAQVVFDKKLIGLTPFPLTNLPANAESVCLRLENHHDQIVSMKRTGEVIEGLYVRLSLRTDEINTAIPSCQIRSQVNLP